MSDKPSNKTDHLDEKGHPESKTTYVVGHGKPPVASQFKKGRSGNPNGRPRGAKNRSPRNDAADLGKFILKQLDELIPSANGAPQKTWLEAITQTSLVKAVKGNAAHTRIILRYAHLENLTNRQDCREYSDLVAAEIARLRPIIEERRASGLSEDDIIPHPDDWYFDLELGIPRVIGPSHPREKAAWDKIDALLRDKEKADARFDAIIAELKTMEDGQAKDALWEVSFAAANATQEIRQQLEPMPKHDQVWRLTRLNEKDEAVAKANMNGAKNKIRHSHEKIT